jgi:peptidoglycan/LPS O-acetylase OafA/YrhL
MISHMTFHKNDLNARLPALDGVRAIAVLAVIANHSGLSSLGGIGVDIFFGLSGYLITGILLDAKASTPSPCAYLVPFYMRRALRILPLAWTI